ncbi:MAG TPA: GatB/YqeY domain-containing protein [Polyangiaceae bacterium]|nr:GatB/YqeY domain-containing protein [Polyangiaceae bacterium]
MLIDQIKQRMFQAMKAGQTLEKEVLRTVIGEVTRSGEEATDERVLGALKKLVKANQETLTAATDPEQRRTLELEIQLLNTFLPATPGPEQLCAILAPTADAIRAAAGPGPAMGIAMKFLKSANVTAESRDVQAAIAELRKHAS